MVQNLELFRRSLSTWARIRYDYIRTYVAILIIKFIVFLTITVYFFTADF